MKKFKTISIPISGRHRRILNECAQKIGLRSESGLLHLIFKYFFEGKIDAIFLAVQVPISKDKMKYIASELNEPISYLAGISLHKALKKLSKEKHRSLSGQAAAIIEMALDGDRGGLQNEWGGK